jgi:hypothetical protein
MACSASMMTIHPAFLRARLKELKLLAKQASPAERARLEGTASVIARATETIAGCQEAVQPTKALLDHGTARRGGVRFSHDRVSK